MLQGMKNNNTMEKVIKSPAFYANLCDIMSKLDNSHKLAEMAAALVGTSLRRSPLERLKERGVYTPEMVRKLYLSAYKHELRGYPVVERRFILELGEEAVRVTLGQMEVSKIKGNETEGKDGHGHY